MELKVFNYSVQGANHIKVEKECQDASISFLEKKMAIAIVCDGHGGDDYVRSSFGSLIATEVGLKNIKEFLRNIDEDELILNPEKYLNTLKESIIASWNMEINKHFEEYLFSEDELQNVSERAKQKYESKEYQSAYGTTFIATVMTEKYWFALQIGDGKCVSINKEGNLEELIPIDENCFLNETTSICDSNAIENFRHYFSQDLPIAIFVGSDGVDDSFQNEKQLYKLYKSIVFSFATENFDKAKEDLENYLPVLSAKGSGDDISIGVIFDLEKIKEHNLVKEFEINESKEVEIPENFISKTEEEPKENNVEENKSENETTKKEIFIKSEQTNEASFTTKNEKRILEQESVEFCDESSDKKEDADIYEKILAISEDCIKKIKTEIYQSIDDIFDEKSREISKYIKKLLEDE